MILSCQQPGHQNRMASADSVADSLGETALHINTEGDVSLHYTELRSVLTSHKHSRHHLPPAYLHLIPVNDRCIWRLELISSLR